MRISYLAIPLAIAAMFSQTACSPKEQEPMPSIYQMGERVPLGHLIYTVFERQWMTQIGTGMDARIPQNRFYLIRISAVNSGGSPAILPTISLVDDAGGSFSEIENGDGITDFIGALRQIGPAETAQGNLVFDVPPKHYKLKLTDEDARQVALVDIPLSFEPDAPEVVTPLTDHTGDLTKK
jgi:hypothetical protein